MSKIQPIRWDPDRKILVLLDQTLLPGKESYREYDDPGEVAEAIRSLIVRGAPAIGCTAAFGVVLAALKYGGDDPEEIRGHIRNAMNLLSGTRPTAVNLFWAIERIGIAAASPRGQRVFPIILLATLTMFSISPFLPSPLEIRLTVL